jgi:hypothetical protein
MSETLSDLMLSDKSKRPKILDDCERVIEDEVKSKSGVTGLAIKGSFKIVKKVKPGIVREAMDGLLDDFVGRVEPFWEKHVDGGGDKDNFAESLKKRSPEVADALLGITDDRAKRAKNKTLKGAYEKLRPQARKHVAEAIPRVAAMMGRHLG